jgi:hypothetical protein
MVHSGHDSTRFTQSPDRLPDPFFVDEHDVTDMQELRKSIVPSAAAYKLDKLMAAIETYQQRTRQRVGSRTMTRRTYCTSF